MPTVRVDFLDFDKPDFQPARTDVVRALVAWRSRSKSFNVPMRVSGISFVVALTILAAGCSPGGAACAGPTCGTGYECLANRCAAAGGTPVPRDTERVVLSPVAIALVTGRGAAAPESTTVTLGSDAAPESALYLRFGSTYKTGGEVAAAFLLLTPAAGTETTRDDTRLQVKTLVAPWSADSLARGIRPAASRPVAEGIARAEPPSLVRIDVTSLVRSFARTPYDSGMAVAAARAHGPGVTLVTVAEGAPQLEVYLAGVIR